MTDHDDHAKSAAGAARHIRSVPMDEDKTLAHRPHGLARLTRAVVHDARGASSAMSIHAELLLTTIETTSDVELQDRQRRYVSVLQDERRRLQRLVESFVAYVVPGDPTVTTFDLAELAAEVTVLAAAYAGESHVGVELDAGEVSALVSAPRGLLHKVVLDLLMDVVGRCTRSDRVATAVEQERNLARLVIRVPPHAEVPPEAVAGWSSSFDRAGAVLRASGETLRVELPETPRGAGA